MTKTKDFSAIATKMLEDVTREERDGNMQYFAKREGNPVTAFVLSLANENFTLDEAYEFTVSALHILADGDADGEESAHERISELTEADVYTSDLTGWLNNSNYNVYWLTEALENYSPTDGFNALAIAQQLAKENIGHLLVDWMQDNQ